jgi:protein gp37
MATKIQWCDATWNPVWGCNGGCEYCYARSIANRFSMTMAIRENKFLNISTDDIDELYNDLSSFKPTLLHHRLNKYLQKNPMRIFINSMSDPAYWKTDWMENVLMIIKKYPKHSFLLLTKFPHNLVYMKNFDLPTNLHIGVTITHNNEVNRWNQLVDLFPNNAKFISFEPLTSKINLINCLYLPAWIIVGGMTGTKFNPMIDQWVYQIRHFCETFEIPFFFKSWGSWIPSIQSSTEAKETLKAVIWNNTRYLKKCLMNPGDTLDGDLVQEFPNF